MERVLEGKIAVVTGGTGALGRAVAATLLEAGARVHIPWWAEGELAGAERVLERWLREGTARLVQADVTDPEGVESLFEGVHAAEGRLDALVHTVGGFAWAALGDTSPALWDRMLALNATSAFLCTRAAASGMGEDGGRMVLVGAYPALDRGATGMSAYGASKAAVVHLGEALARELASRRISVNTVIPGMIDTPANREAMPDSDRSTWTDPGEIAAVIRFLLSDDGGVVTGASLTLRRP
jgi:NAD(P)-dependent dehydrogenase (short-subunit alcohol dehydrogenase family)